MATDKHTAGDWERLGAAVLAARRRAGHRDMKEWALLVGKSTRILLGLERGEPVGRNTLRDIEELLHWPPGYCDVILTDPSADLAPETKRPGKSIGALPDEELPLDEYSTEELLEEVRSRYVSLAYTLQNETGAVTTTSRTEGNATIYETISPAELRRRRGKP